jgi:GH35 family endo-1,4-beta-xylanase
MLDQLETEEKNKKYKEHFKNLFNIATLPFYWNTLEPERGKTRYTKDSEYIYRRPTIDACVEFCKENGIEPREHGLMYAGMFPKWLKDLPTEEVKELIEKRYKEIAERYADDIPCIEVTNEMFWWWDNSLIDFYFSPEFLPFAYKLAEKYFPNNTLSINDMPLQFFGAKNIVPTFLNDKTTPYYLQIEKLIREGCKIDEIGIQYHMFYDRNEEEYSTKNYYSMEHMYRALDLFNQLGKNMQVTEITIPAYSNDPEDEQIQAEIIKRLYTVWFSYPSISQIIYWNLPDGYAHAAEKGDMTKGENRFYGGLLRHDMSKKPAYYMIEKLFKEVWHTEETLTTNTNGVVATKGFYGEYEVVIESNGNKKTCKLNISKNSDNKTTIVV